MTQDTITRTLEAASRAALEAILDAGVYEEHRALSLEAFESQPLAEEVHRALLACGAQTDGEGAYLFGSLEDIQHLFDEVTRLLEDEADGLEPEDSEPALSEPARFAKDEFIVFDDAPWRSPEALPSEDVESLGLEAKGYQLRKIPFSSIRVVPANNPRKKTARAGVVRLARNISKRGLQQPVTVRPDPEDAESFELVFGYRRHAAIGYAIAQGWLPEDDDVICIVRKLNDSQVRLAALSENEEREDVDLLDQAEGWARLRLKQTEAAIADAAGLTVNNVKRCIKVAFGVCEEAKLLYRENKLDWNALTAFSYGSLEAQRAYLETTQGSMWRLSSDYIRQAMTATDFKLANARFTLEDYETAGGVLETDLWGSADGTRLLSRDVIERLQSQWAQQHTRELQTRGFAFVEQRAGEWTWWSEFSKVARGTEGAGAVIHMRPDWAVDVIENVVPNQANPSNRNSNQNPSDSPSSGTEGAGAIPPKPEEPKTEFSEAGVTLARRTRTAALQAAILENDDPKLPLALAVMGFLGERELRFRVAHLGEVDAISSKTILDELEVFASRVPNLSFSPSNGLAFSVTGRFGATNRLETLQAVLNLPKSDLERLHRLLVATMVGDFASATDGISDNRRRKLNVDGLIAALADHLGVSGGEALEVTEEYLKTISFRKARLRPYLVRAFGDQLAGALLESPKAKIIAELLAHKDKLDGFTPPELDFALHGGAVVKLEVTGDDLDDFEDSEDEEPSSEPNASLISEDELDFLETEQEPVAADD